jgi:hypothetical protein
MLSLCVNNAEFSYVYAKVATAYIIERPKNKI